MSSSTPLLFVIVGRNEPLYEAEFQKRVGASGGSSDATTRQNYFVLHSSLDLVEKSAWTTNNMYLKVVDKVRTCGAPAKKLFLLSGTDNFSTSNRRDRSTTNTFRHS